MNRTLLKRDDLARYMRTGLTSHTASTPTTTLSIGHKGSKVLSAMSRRPDEIMADLLFLFHTGGISPAGSLSTIHYPLSTIMQLP